MAVPACWAAVLFLQGAILLSALNRPMDAIAPLQRCLQVLLDGGCRDDARLLREALARAG